MSHLLSHFIPFLLLPFSHDSTFISGVGVQSWVIMFTVAKVGLGEKITDTKTKECPRGRAGGGKERADVSRRSFWTALCFSGSHANGERSRVRSMLSEEPSAVTLAE